MKPIALQTCMGLKAVLFALSMVEKMWQFMFRLLNDRS
ncbi:hypothetical protein GTCCBUS3UF5_35810 [Geobacillus thermoleovorans CCB_US3_UF5]|uniref:Transposase n=1 Tax=Geobacillus thermoleovorans CCB_US3_UF5 TaxID=1111068 RepID=A0ABM5MMC1_GEOTH|nr:hypothetical protein GTCCBUS3UF5_35810 [Geobacillus thermoleovorans CCB_US3_UF5]GAJ57372.1 hypothetical protein B23_0561 [Geobacillus thermoleovorans B23]